MSGEITTHFGAVKDAGHELSQKIATLHTYFQLSQTTMGLSCFFLVFFVMFDLGFGSLDRLACPA